MAKFSVTFEIITEESANDGECAESGYLEESVSLRDAARHCYRWAELGIEPDSSHTRHIRWLTFHGGQNMVNGAYENRSLHIPDSVTDSSRVRIARVMGWRRPV